MRKLWKISLLGLLMLAMAALCPRVVEAAPIRTTQRPMEEPELYGGYRIYTMYQTSWLYRSDADGSNEVEIEAATGENSLGLANNTSVMYSVYDYENSIVTVWRASIATLQKTQIAKIKTKKAYYLCGYYNKILYLKRYDDGQPVVYRYSLNTKKSKRLGKINPLQYSNYLVYSKASSETLEGGTKLVSLKRYNLKTKKSISIDSRVERYTRVGKYIYYVKDGTNLYNVAGMSALVPAMEVIRYDIVKNTRTTLMKRDRSGAVCLLVRSNGMYFGYPSSSEYYFVEYGTGDVREASFSEIYPV